MWSLLPLNKMWIQKSERPVRPNAISNRRSRSGWTAGQIFHRNSQRLLLLNVKGICPKENFRPLILIRLSVPIIMFSLLFLENSGKVQNITSRVIQQHCFHKTLFGHFLWLKNPPLRLFFFLPSINLAVSINGPLCNKEVNKDESF